MGLDNLQQFHKLLKLFLAWQLNSLVDCLRGRLKVGAPR